MLLFKKSSADSADDFLFFRIIWCAFLYLLSFNQSDQNHNDRNDQQNVDEPADGVSSNHAEEPEND